jgi:hypothetical protein
MNEVHTLPSYFFKNYYNISPHQCLIFFPSSFPTKTSFASLPCMLHVPPISSSLSRSS